MAATGDAQRIERALQLLDARLARSDLFNDGTVKIIPSTSNVGPLGLFGFALTTAMLQGVFTGVASDVGNLVTGFGMFFGGLAQFTAGILEFQRKNTFGTVAFCSYGAFWMGLCFFRVLALCLKLPAPIEGERMMLSLWGILTFMLWLCTFSMNLITSALFLSLSLLFFFLAGGQPQADHVNWMRFAGSWGFLVAGLAFYDGLAALMKEVYGRQILPVFPFKPVNKISGGNFGTQRRIDTEELELPAKV